MKTKKDKKMKIHKKRDVGYFVMCGLFINDRMYWQRVSCFWRNITCKKCLKNEK